MQHPSPRTAAYGFTLLVALAIACDLLWMPIQVSDSLGEILDAQRSPSVWASFTENLGTEAYLRPLRIAQIKALFDVAQGAHYWLVYRGFHALLLIAAVLLFTRTLRVSTAADFAAAAFALVVLIGLNTFRGTVQEAFPINHFLEILLLCLLTLNLARSRGGFWIDVVGALTFIVAALTLESGLLVWVVAASAWAVGWRGISARGLAMLTTLLLGYLYVRFVYLSTGVPAMTERSSGYMLELLDPVEIARRFGAHPLWFNTYNIMASTSSVLFSEPRSGVFEAVRGWLDGRPLVRFVVPVATSVVTTGLIVWASTRRVARWRELDDTARFFLVFVAVLGASATLSFAYTKDEIMSTAGAFYALAAFGAMREALRTTAGMRRTAGRTFALLLCILSVGWTVRSAGVHYILRSQAFKHQADWVALPGLRKNTDEWPSDPVEERLILRLRADAVGLVLPNTRIDHPGWPAGIWTD